MSEYDLEKSYRNVGAIYPILVDRNGNVVDGFHRRQVDEKWPVQVLGWVKTREDQLVARIVANTCRRTVSKEERKRELTELATIMANRGVPLGRIAEEIAEKTGLSESYVRQILPKHLKLEPKVKAAEAKWEAISKEKAPFGERGENLHLSVMQTFPTFSEAPPAPDLGRVEFTAEQKVLAEQENLASFYPKEILDFVAFRIGQTITDIEKVMDAEFLREAIRQLLSLIWGKISRDQTFLNSLRAEYDELLRKL